MLEELDALFYFDEMLIRQLGSFVIEGYIDIRTKRNIKDKTLTGRANVINREGTINEERKNKDEREGYKTETYYVGDNCQKGGENGAGIENRDFERCEEETKKVYTYFNFYQNYFTTIKGKNMFRNITEADVINGNIRDGEIVGIKCCIGNNCPYKAFETIVEVLNAIGKENLGKLFKESTIELPKAFNLDKTYALLNLIYNKLYKDGNRDTLFTLGKTSVIVCTNSTCYCNERENVIRGSGCNFKIIGKVVRTFKKNEGINIFRKLGECGFYDEILRALLKDIEIINKLGFNLPTKILFEIGGEGIMILPLSISS